MENSEKFVFADFTYKEYERLLVDANSFYSFISHREYLEQNPVKPFLIWRHDLDMSIENALRFAEIENKLGIKATYFIHLHSEYYHFFEKETTRMLNEIKSLGHILALHFDTHFYDIKSESELDFYVNKEKVILEELFDCRINVFSFHNTNEFILNCNKVSYGGLINTYASEFQKKLPYCSDSYGIWRFERLPDIIKQRKYNGLQVLTHPELWSDEIRSPYQRVMDIITRRADQVKSNYDSFLLNNGRNPIDW